MEGENLISQIVELSGLPSNWAEHRIKSLIDQHGFAVSQIRLDEIRIILADLLKEALIDAKFELLSDHGKESKVGSI